SPESPEEPVSVSEVLEAGDLDLSGVSEENEDTVEDWLSEAIDDVESASDFEADFDFTPEIQGNEQFDEPEQTVEESLPEPEPE
ncbi:hypothetical protein, partial [Vibrio gallaecicus]